MPLMDKAFQSPAPRDQYLEVQRLRVELVRVVHELNATHDHLSRVSLLLALKRVISDLEDAVAHLLAITAGLQEERSGNTPDP